MTRPNSALDLRRVSERVTSAAAALALTALMLVASDVRADSIAFAPSVLVQYSQDDLSTEAGANRVYRKLKRAARDVCGLAHGLKLQQRIAAQKCFDEALASAVRNVNGARVTALHQHAGRTLG